MRHWPLGPRCRIRATVAKQIHIPSGFWPEGCPGSPNLQPLWVSPRQVALWGIHSCSRPPGERVGLGLPRVKANLSEMLVSSVLGVNLTSAEDYGAFACSVWNVSSASFTLRNAGEGVTLGQRE